MKIPRIIVSGTSSRAGKTIISIGLMRALKNRGYEVQPFKIGPDFIDPSFHFFATGRNSRNLDSFMMSKKSILASFQKNARDADIAVIEGTMGLYDSHNAIDEKGSTAEVSKILKSPIALVVNIERISRTTAAFVLGYKVFDKKVDIKGAILNRAGNPRHARKAKLAVEKLAQLQVFGVIPRDKNIVIPERHLGLVPAYERKNLETLFNALAEIVEEHLDVDKIIKAAEEAPELKEVKTKEKKKRKFNCKVGVIKDKVFTFYYIDNLEAIEELGGELVFIDSLKDKALPEVDALYIGGGFPEIFAKELERNSSLREDIYEFCNSGKLVYAECAGLMYLGEKIYTLEGEGYEMVGFLPLNTRMRKKFQALGYTIHEVIENNPISKRGEVLVGHEFHHSEPELLGKARFVFKVKRGKGIINGYDGMLKKNTLANYLHLHVLSHKKMMERFLSLAEKNKKYGRSG